MEGVLGRGRYERRDVVDAPGGYRNGFGKPRRLSFSGGTIALRRPRVRGLTERFESRLLPAFKRRTEEVGRLLPELSLHGLALGDFDLALRELLGEGAQLSATSIARLKASWKAEYEVWKNRSLADLEAVYLLVQFVGLRSRRSCQPSWTPSFRLGLLANLIGSDRRDPVPVAQTRHPFHLVVATRQGRDDIALGMFATIPKDNQVTRPD